MHGFGELSPCTPDASLESGELAGRRMAQLLDRIILWMEEILHHLHNRHLL